MEPQIHEMEQKLKSIELQLQKISKSIDMLFDTIIILAQDAKQETQIKLKQLGALV